MNIGKFLRASNLRNICKRLLLKLQKKKTPCSHVLTIHGTMVRVTGSQPRFDKYRWLEFPFHTLLQVWALNIKATIHFHKVVVTSVWLCQGCLILVIDERYRWTIRKQLVVVKIGNNINREILSASLVKTTKLTKPNLKWIGTRILFKGNILKFFIKTLAVLICPNVT